VADIDALAEVRISQEFKSAAFSRACGFGHLENGRPGDVAHDEQMSRKRHFTDRRFYNIRSFTGYRQIP